MLGKQAIIDFFVRNAILDIFYLPGIHTLSLNEGLFAQNIKVFVPRHEASMAFMADGFARVSGKIGVLVVTPGPGLGNVVTGCMEAYGDDIPLLIIHIDTGREEIGKGILHEVVDPENMFRYVTKKIFFVHGREDFVTKIEAARKTALTERKGPVLISIPYTLLEKEVSSRDDSESNSIPPEQFNDLAGLEMVLLQKKRPIIIGGKSLMFEQSRPLLDEICMKSSIPFLTTTSGKGILDENNLWCFGNIMQKGIAKEIVSSADIAIAVGTRLRDVDAKRRGVKIQDLVHVDIDNTWFDKNYPTSYKVAGDLLPLLYDLKNAVRGKIFEWPLQKLKRSQQRERQRLEKTFLGFRLISIVRDSIPEDTITVWDLNLMAYWAEYFFPVRHQHSFIMPRGISSIFYALPAAIGVKIARPEKPCLAICGDGGVLPSIAELSTIRKYNIPIGILIFNNNSFGILEDYMRATYSIEGMMALENPDFVRIASAFGIQGKRVKTLVQLKNFFRNFVRWDEPFLIELCGPIFPPPWRS